MIATSLGGIPSSPRNASQATHGSEPSKMKLHPAALAAAPKAERLSSSAASGNEACRSEGVGGVLVESVIGESVLLPLRVFRRREFRNGKPGNGPGSDGMSRQT